MFHVNRRITGVKTFKIIKNQLFICNENKELILDGALIQKNVDGTTATLIGDDFYFHSSEEYLTYCFNLKSKSIRTIPYTLWLHTFHANHFLSCEFLWDIRCFKMGIYNTKKHLLVLLEEPYDIWNLVRVNDSIYYFNMTKKIVKKVSLMTGDFEWQTSLAVERIIKIVGIFASKLIVTYEMTQNRTGAAALDTHTGVVLWQQLIQGLDTFYATGTQKNTLINLKSGGLWQNGVQMVKGSNLFAEIDLQTGTVLREGILQALDESDLQVRTFEVKEGKIYFTANHQGSFGATAIGVLSLQTLQLLWWEVVKMDQADGFGNFLLNSVTVSANQLGILDKTGVLHLYEKQTGFRPKKTHPKGLALFEVPLQVTDPPKRDFIEEDFIPLSNIGAAPSQDNDLDF